LQQNLVSGFPFLKIVKKTFYERPAYRKAAAISACGACAPSIFFARNSASAPAAPNIFFNHTKHRPQASAPF